MFDIHILKSFRCTWSIFKEHRVAENKMEGEYYVNYIILLRKSAILSVQCKVLVFLRGYQLWKWLNGLSRHKIQQNRKTLCKGKSMTIIKGPQTLTVRQTFTYRKNWVGRVCILEKGYYILVGKVFHFAWVGGTSMNGLKELQCHTENTSLKIVCINRVPLTPLSRVTSHKPCHEVWVATWEAGATDPEHWIPENN